jgi:DNA invertase Pin-like site-specific DNA recombinase
VTLMSRSFRRGYTAEFLQFCIMRSLNQFTSDNLRGEMQDKMIGKIRAGGTIGKAPIGYLNTIERVNGIEVRSVELDAERAALTGPSRPTPPASGA